MLRNRIDLPDNAQPKPLRHSDAATAHVERVLTMALYQVSLTRTDTPSRADRWT